MVHFRFLRKGCLLYGTLMMSHLLDFFSLIPSCTFILILTVHIIWIQSDWMDSLYHKNTLTYNDDRAYDQQKRWNFLAIKRQNFHLWPFSCEFLPRSRMKKRKQYSIAESKIKEALEKNLSPSDEWFPISRHFPLFLMV